ncbi:uncharacterized protein KY384_000671 [Bacidia gigantensis]|uniref:uncharacterized protein n=1 Tax=Bacidia gigantensis TaxID=2732470 RepID=UPI001D0488BB|nr:uncharacterized protein KY384_000671 [Bacidia gigantensis]KAG8525909.1 hypothetical protein KY384_000671 [Bacidia gigantensis]
MSKIGFWLQNAAPYSPKERDFEAINACYGVTSIRQSDLLLIYKFPNVRFGDAPTGTMRFGEPSTPTAGVTPSDPTGVIQCHTVALSTKKKKGDKDGSPAPKVPYIGKPNAGEGEDPNQTEDCLFLDIYLPASLFANGTTPSASVPVVVWFYGGAFVEGSKDGPDPNNPLYTGVGAVNAAKALGEDVVFVAGNYRLGAFGWLAGQYMETAGAPNAGLHDQRFLLEWVQTYIGQVGGDNSSSPAYEIMWDRTGTLNQTYENFVGSAVPGCTSRDINCVRELGLDDQALINANADLVNTYYNTGVFPVGPAVDGILINRLPVNEFATNSYWQGLKSLIVSHVEDESGIFVPSITDDSGFTSFVSNFMPQSSLSSVRSAIMSAYPSSSYPDAPKARASAVIRDSSFTCNVQQLFDAYGGTADTYVLKYDVTPKSGLFTIPADHGTDLLPTFWNGEVDFAKFLASVANKISPIPIPPFFLNGFSKFYAAFSPKFQAYLVSFAISGNPNSLASENPFWPTATADGSSIGNVLQAQATPTDTQFTVIVDEINTSGLCSFWKTLAAEIDTTTTTTTVAAVQTPPPFVPSQDVLGGEADRDELK